MNKHDLLNKIDPSDDEEVIIALRSHPLFFSRVFSYVIIFVILILTSFYFFGASLITSILIYAAFIIVGFLFFKYYYTWANTSYLITNHRVISHQQLGWFKKRMCEASLSDIQMLSHEINGFWNDIFGRGDIYIRASGVKGGDVVFANVPNPYEIEKKISNIKKQYTGSSAEIKQEKEDEPKNKRPIIR